MKEGTEWENRRKKKIESKNKNHIKHNFADPSWACRLRVSIFYFNLSLSLSIALSLYRVWWALNSQPDIYYNLWHIIIIIIINSIGPSAILVCCCGCCAFSIYNICVTCCEARLCISFVAQNDTMKCSKWQFQLFAMRKILRYFFSQCLRCTVRHH